MTENISSRGFIGNIISALLGVFWAAFIVSFFMTGFWAFVIALMGGVLTSITFSLVKLKRTAPALALGYAGCLVVFVWFGLQWHLTVNLWAVAVFALVQALTRVFIADTLLIKWLKQAPHNDAR